MFPYELIQSGMFPHRVHKKTATRFFAVSLKIAYKFPSNLAYSYSSQCQCMCVCVGGGGLKLSISPDVYTYYLVKSGQIEL